MEAFAEQLADAVAVVLEPWLRRCVVDTALRVTGSVSLELKSDAALMASERAPEVLAALDDLLTTDVDAQRTNPLSILRGAVRHRLRSCGDTTCRCVARRFRRPFVSGRHLRRSSPATWSDVDEALVEPGIDVGGVEGQNRPRSPPCPVTRMRLVPEPLRPVFVSLEGQRPREPAKTRQPPSNADRSGRGGPTTPGTCENPTATLQCGPDVQLQGRTTPGTCENPTATLQCDPFGPRWVGAGQPTLPSRLSR